MGARVGGRHSTLARLRAVVAMVFCLLPLSLWACGAYAGGKSRVDLTKIRVRRADCCGIPGDGCRRSCSAGKRADLPTRRLICTRPRLLQLCLAVQAGPGPCCLGGYDQGLLRLKLLVVGSAEEAERLAGGAAPHGCELEIRRSCRTLDEDPGPISDSCHLSASRDIGSALSAEGAQG